jgi:hypothetical protein
MAFSSPLSQLGILCPEILVKQEPFILEGHYTTNIRLHIKRALSNCSNEKHSS